MCASSEAEPSEAEPSEADPSEAGDESPEVRPEPEGEPVLWVVATPIGNLGDLSHRAAEALRLADIVAAEDTRRTRNLLSHLGITKKELVRLDEHASEAQVEALAARIAGGLSCALVSDAGTPVVSDPGSALVRAARAEGLRIVPIPGASAVTAALSASGYAMAAFRFVGFLPRKGRERSETLGVIAADRDVVVFFESPHRITDTLIELARLMPERRALVARELTKKHEELLEAPLSELAQRANERAEWLGELTVVLAPWTPPAESPELAAAELDRRIDEGLAGGQRAKDIAARLSLELGVSKRDVYERVLDRERKHETD
jgi:16S rRNA (cytidine1402-2'-O)-methyltransferase